MIPLTRTSTVGLIPLPPVRAGFGPRLLRGGIPAVDFELDPMPDEYAVGALQIEAGKDTRQKLDRAADVGTAIVATGSGLFGLLIGLGIGYLLGRK